ncbi:MAG TPA: response regulator, partial [Candidatus Dormibacteraeota bacterium]|nr:response regulator [Candidatus Dormibacteraeota bacterium]
MNRATRILLVDDDPVVLRVFSEVLRLDGYDLRDVSTAQAALTLISEKWPDMVISDVMLPGFSGLELCRRIKRDAFLRDLFVVLISGEATSSHEQVTGLDVGADDYLVKSIPAAEFRARIRSLIRLQEATSELRASQEMQRRM